MIKLMCYFLPLLVCVFPCLRDICCDSDYIVGTSRYLPMYAV